MHIIRTYARWLAVIFPVSLALTLIVPAAASAAPKATLALVANPTNPTYGQTVNLVAQLTITGSNDPAIGQYSIYDGTTALISGAMPNLVNSGFAWQTSSLSVGTHSLTVKYAGQVNGLSATSNAFIVQVSPKPLSITISPLTGATVGSAYSATLAATGGTTPYTWSIASGSSAPAGLTLSTAGVLSGTPTTASSGSGTTFKVQVKDSSTTPQTATVTLTLKIAADPLSITSTSLTSGTVRIAYSAQLRSSGGTGNVTWKLANGSSLVAGLTLSTTGAISGTPTAATSGAGSFTVIATDSASPVHTATAPVTYTINLPQVATPTFTPLAGTYSSAQNVSIKDATAGAVIYYTTNGDVPTTSSTRYTGVITVSATQTIKAIATASYYTTSAPASALYTINLPQAATPTFTPLAGTYSSAQNVSIKDATTGATIYYTTNGNIPTTSSTKYIGAITVSATETIKAIATAPNYTTSAPASALYTISLPQAATPTFTPLAGTYNSAQNVSITDATTGATIYYTTNGNIPTTSSTKYIGAITVSATETIKAIATAPNYTTSAPASALYTISLPTAKCTADGSGNGKIRGAYAFQLSQTFPVHSGGLGFLVGAFTADGLGNITGSFDMNSPFGQTSGATSGTLTGNYSVGSDDRGVLNVIVPQGSGGTQTLSYCLALDSISSNVAAAGRMVENDTTSGNAASGAFYAQTGGSSSLNSAKGSWVFGMQGGMAASSGTLVYRSAIAGVLGLDGSGSISSGQMDVSVDVTTTGTNIVNASFHDVGLTGSYTLASNGRGVMTLTVPSSNEAGGGTSHIIFWMAGPNHILLMGADAGSITAHHPVNAGEAYLRTTSTFTNATLAGTSVYVSNGVSNNHSAQYDQLYLEAGIVGWDGKGNINGAADVVNAGDVTLATNNAFTATYSVDANGRVAAGGPVFYIIGPNQLFGVSGGLKASLIYAEKQIVPSGGFTAASLSGGYSLSTLWYDAVNEPIFTGEVTSGGAGSYSEVVDFNNDGNVQAGIAVTQSYTAGPLGRFVTMNGATPSYAGYFVSPNKAYMIPINSAAKGIPLYMLNHQ